jgi:hypothetical protein
MAGSGTHSMQAMKCAAASPTAFTLYRRCQSIDMLYRPRHVSKRVYVPLYAGDVQF